MYKLSWNSESTFLKKKKNFKKERDKQWLFSYTRSHKKTLWNNDNKSNNHSYSFYYVQVTV